MRVGNLSQTIYRRSILKQIHTDQDVALTKISQDENCFGVKTTAKQQVLQAEASLSGDEKDLCVFAIARVVNALVLKGAEPKGVSLSLMLPEYAFESRIKMMVAYAEETAKRLGIQILRAEAQIVPKISTTIVHATATGTLDALEDMTAEPYVGQDVVMVGYMGLEGTLRILHTREEELRERFTAQFLTTLESYSPLLFVGNTIQSVRQMKGSVLYQITDGGILAALWNLAERTGEGISVDMRKIPVKQESIEICECFQLNPYQLTSAGAVLIATEKGEEVVEMLEKEGVPAVLIGRLTKGNDRVLHNAGEVRYLDKPAADELFKML